MGTISVSVNFCAGHRILGLDGEGAKCKNIHGHSYRATLTFRQDRHPRDGDFLEYGEVKAWVRGMFLRYFDHAFIVDIHDDFCLYLDVNHMKHYQLEGPPTTEAMAEAIGTHTREQYPQLLRVELQEGPDNCATWEYELQTLDVRTWAALGDAPAR